MKKIDIIHFFEKELGFTSSFSKKMVNLYFFYIVKALYEKQRIEIRGFGSFFLKFYKERVGLNPRTREVIPISEKYQVFFKPSKKLLKFIDNIE
jgi:integration host factor subunit beta